MPASFTRLACYLLLFAAIDSTIETTQAGDQSYETQTGIAYRTEIQDDVYAQARCRLDLYFPKAETDFSTVIWFHGGGLTKGERAIPDRLKNQGFAVVGAGYRLHPNVTAPVYIEDAAAAVAWVFKNIERHGGSPRKIFVTGHSAGAYLAMMIGFDKQWLHKHDINADELAGLIPLSGQTITHFTIRSEQGIGDKQPVIDRFAPLFHVRKDAPPILLITGDRNKELLGRYEENAYLWRMLKETGHRDLELLELQGYDHGGMAEPAYPLLTRFVQQRSKRAQ